MDDVKKWLGRLKLDYLSRVFEVNQVDFDTLRQANSALYPFLSLGKRYAGVTQLVWTILEPEKSAKFTPFA